MSSTGGDKADVVVEKPAAEQAVVKAKTPKEKKAKTAKTASHPPYFQMIKEALLALKEKGGSSPHAIAKYMEDKHKAVLPENFKKMLTLQLKNSASKGKLTKVKASYKLSESGKKEKALAAAGGKKPTAASKKPKQTKSKKPAAPVAKATAATTTTAARPKKATKATKKAAAKKQTPVKKAKKMTPAKAKQPKSIKSPAAKKARKAAV
ncbi:unnamed protein product [Lactuca virosa]|uniref:H15 domain-containing protein n=1 Tax=Lactuca virosa TaxID=75947 RepID=A0AAU9LFU0_9ASTR|nr:unnamed protein product [Lactuca virosa]